MSVRFPMTEQGCANAMHYLRLVAPEALEKELSTDGYTIIALANDIYERRRTLDETTG